MRDSKANYDRDRDEYRPIAEPNRRKPVVASRAVSERFNRFLVSFITIAFCNIAIDFAFEAESTAAEAKLVRLEETRPRMGCPFRIVVYAANEAAAKSAIDAAFDRVSRLNHAFSDYDPESELMRLCAKAGGPAIAVSDDAGWAAMLQVLGASTGDSRFGSHAERLANAASLDEFINPLTRVHNAYELTRKLQAAGVAAAVCATNKSLAEDEHVLGRNFFVELEHPEVGVRKHAGIPWRMSESESRVKSPAPLIGQHTEEVLRRVLGYDDAEVRKLSEAGALE